MKLSIIIPARNEAERITRCLERAAALQPDELILVDGQSEDATCELAGCHPCRIIESPPGRAIQQNAGAAAATGDVLLFLHADNWLEPAGRGQIEQALQNPAVLAGAFAHRIDAMGWLYRLLEWHDSWRVRWQGMAYGDQGLFFRREVFEQLGGFEEIPLMEDVRIIRALRRRFRTRPVLLTGPLHVDARRWQKHGIVRQSLRNFCLRQAERLGVSPARLAEFYAPHWKQRGERK